MSVRRGATEEGSSFVLILTAVLLSAGQLVARLPLLRTRRFDPDELEHMHVAWSIAQGQVPFRDFFEHHTPLFHYLLAWWVTVAGPERSAARAMEVLFEVRYATWALSVAIAVATFVLARRLRDATTAWVALVLVSGNIVVALRAIEIRPDGLAALLLLLALIALHAGVTSGHPGSGRTRILLVAAGLSLGAAVLTSQKLLFAGPPTAAMIAWYIASSGFGGRTRERLVGAAGMAAAVLLTWSIAIAFLASQGAAVDFVNNVLFDAARWHAENTAASVLTFLVRYEPWFFALSAGGAVVLLREHGDGRRLRISNVFLLVFGGGLFLGLFAIPVPYPQYCLTFIPLFTIVAAGFLVDLTRRLSRAHRGWAAFRPSGLTAALAIVVCGLAGMGLSVARPMVVTAVVYPLLVAGATLAVLTLPVYRRSDLALAALLVVLAVLPAQTTRWMYGIGDQGQFAGLRYVLDHTSSDDVVLDGWSGYGVFRRHANYYWMLHPGVRAMLPPDMASGLVRQLSGGEVVPQVVILDRDLRALSPDLVRFVETHYGPAGVGDIYVRRSRK